MPWSPIRPACCPENRQMPYRSRSSRGRSQPQAPMRMMEQVRRQRPAPQSSLEGFGRMKPQNDLLSATGTTIFTVMSALAVQHDAINLGQGFPDYEGPEDVVEAAAAALKDNRNQYPPMTGLLELRQAVSSHNKRFYGIDADPNGEVIVTSGATEAITACLMAVLNPGDECVLIEPLYDTYLPVVKLLGAIPKLVRLSPPEMGAAAGRAGRRLRAEDQGHPVQLADEPDRQGLHRRRAGLHRRSRRPGTTATPSATRSTST